ncbi:MAG TPA: CHAD domain-containing protein [Candidatus Krumholzibacteria bacterium]|nr:CHAD domain-containing protein [Candidatus Krumholzibacteria bacterium]
MRDPLVFVARRGRGWRDAERALQRAFHAASEAPVTSRRVYLDTFDFRLHRAGLELFAEEERLVLRDGTTGEVVAASAWRAGKRSDAVRVFARDLEAGDLRDRVAALTEPRALLEKARARVVQHELAARDADGQLVSRVRAEALALRRNGRECSVRVLHIDTPAERTEGEAGAAARVVTAAGYRVAPASAYELLLIAAGKRPRHRARLELAPDISMRAAAAAIFERQLNVMEDNEAGIIDDIDPEFLHDYRVALRRTRTALRLLKGAFTADEFRDFRTRFKALSAPTGALRDLDVHLGARDEYEKWLPAPLCLHLAPAFASLLRQRNERQAQLCTVLSNPAYATLKRDWKRALGRLRGGDPAGLEADEAALPVARAEIASRYERMREIAEKPDALDDAALHRARVQSKRLRYVLEFFAAPLGEPATVAAKRIERLQDALGVYHDAGVLEPVLQDELRAIPAHASDAVQRAAALGAWMGQLSTRREKARRRAVRRIGRLTGKKFENAIQQVTETQ